jgi:CheY-like chemotaxis protein
VALDSAKVNQALLAGRKLLLADDSITIQKVVDLTFGDEGVEVVSVSNGRDAIDQLAEFLPDVVLADVFMPQMNGYEVCEYIKQNEKLKHIPVMLLVGSFEPFDEAEARRVGADDTVTKPFQSVRRLIDKVGALVSGRPTEEQIPTAELARPEVRHEHEPERLTEAELEIVTADTQPLPAELRHMIENLAAERATQEAGSAPIETKVDEVPMETQFTQTPSERPQPHDNADDMPLDLGGFEPDLANVTDDFVLDIDLDEGPDSFYEPSAYVRTPTSKASARDWTTSSAASETPVATADQLADTHEFPKSLDQAGQESERHTSFARSQSAAESKSVNTGADSLGQISLQSLSPEVIDAIARRAVEHLSEKVIRDIAWEVVPDLAELLIKRQLEQKQS